ncbi:MAG: C4-dicarboxylate transporter DctA [Sandaracinaceae bacterium]|nr:C4-dicarboxylate transporter DctA [Sandaracinaceae bacterium]
MAGIDLTASSTPPKRDWLYVYVLSGIVLGAVFGYLDPHGAEAMKPLGDVFVRAIKMLIAPIVFTAVASGIASAGDLKKVGRVGLKALVYFEVMTTVALLIGLVVVHVLQPGAGIHADPSTMDTTQLTATTHGREAQTFVEHLVGIVPESFLGAFVGGEVLPVLFLACLFGGALAGMGERGKPALAAIDQIGFVFFRVLGIVMRAAPFGAFGAMAYTVGHFGIASLGNLAKLMAGFYVTSALFVLLGLGTVCAIVGVRLTSLLRYLKDELLIVLGTSSSESVLPRLMDKLTALGCSPEVVRLVIPTGYSFNLDGTSIYLTMAAIFVAQALDVELTIGEELALLAVLLLTSKGAAAVSGGGFVTLAATLQSTGTIPVAGLSLLLGVDRFMSEARALTNMVGNAVATLAVARWEGQLDLDTARRMLGDGPPLPSSATDTTTPPPGAGEGAS